MTRYNNVLIIRLSALGDVARCTAFIAAFKDKHPESNIYFFTTSFHTELLKLCPLIKGIFSYPRSSLHSIISDGKLEFSAKFGALERSLAQCRQIEYDRIFNFNSSPESAALASYFARGDYTKISGLYIDADYNFKDKNPIWIYNSYCDLRKIYNPLSFNKSVELFSMNARKNNCGYLEISEELKVRTSAKLKNAGIDFDSRFAVFQLGASMAVRRWQKNEIIEFAKYINSKYENPILCIGSPVESEYLDSIINAGSLKAINLSKVLDLQESVCLLARSSFLLTMNTYSLHCAAIFDIPYLCLEFSDLYLPAGGEKAIVYYNESLTAGDVIKVYKYFFEKDNDIEINAVVGRILRFNSNSYNNFEYVNWTPDTVEFYSILEGLIFNTAYFDAFEISGAVDERSIKHFIEYNGGLSVSVREKLRELSEKINVDLAELKWQSVKNKTVNFNSEKYWIADILANYGNDINLAVDKQIEFMNRIIEIIDNMNFL